MGWWRGHELRVVGVREGPWLGAVVLQVRYDDDISLESVKDPERSNP